MITRRFERDDEAGVRRFWEIELDGIASALAVALAGVVESAPRSIPRSGATMARRATMLPSENESDLGSTSEPARDRLESTLNLRAIEREHDWREESLE